MTLTALNVALIVLPLVLIEGLFSGSEIALLSADRLDLQKLAKRSRGARLALDLVNHPERVLSTTLVMTSLCVVGISALLAIYFHQSRPETTELVVILISSGIVVLFGELIPKTIYRHFSMKVAPVVAYPVIWTYYLLWPITRLVSTYTSRLARLVRPIEELVTGKRRTTRDELLNLLSFSQRDSELKSSERRMIKRIFDFKDSDANDALIPLVKVDAIEDVATIGEALDEFKRHRHARMPVYSGRIDNIVGILEVSSLLAASDLEDPIRSHITPAHYAAETQTLEDLMREMHAQNVKMSIVVDEHGGAVGILTLEDIVEEIVGEIQDEYDPDRPLFREIGVNRWIVDARMQITLMNETLAIELPEGDYETLSGFLLQQFGRIPEVKNELYFDTPAGSFLFTIRAATRRHIESVLVEKLAGPPSSSS